MNENSESANRGPQAEQLVGDRDVNSSTWQRPSGIVLAQSARTRAEPERMPYCR